MSKVLYRYKSLGKDEIMSHVLSLETGIPVSRLMELVVQGGKLFVKIRWNGLNPIDDTLENLVRISKDISRLLNKLLNRKTPQLPSVKSSS